MGFMDELKKLTQPYDDEDDFFEGADVSYKPQPKQPEETRAATSAQSVFESSFGDASRAVDAQEAQQAQSAAKAAPAQEGGGFFGKFGFNRGGRPKAAPRERTVNFGGRDTQVILFSPKSFDEAGELVNYMLQNLTVVMTLENVQPDMARRLLDFMSGIAFALQGRITPVSAKTYFITPQNVDILGAQGQTPDQPESYGHYL